MKKLYKTKIFTATKRKLALTALLGCLGFGAQAQFDYASSKAQSVAGTYTDLAATGTAIVTDNTDDANSAVQNIGFTFNYNGQAFRQFVLNTNGYIKLGATAPSAATQLNPIGSGNPADANILAPASFVDLFAAADQTATPTEYRVVTTGTAGSQVCTIQFKNLRDKPTTAGTTTTPSQFSTMQFQVRLYEGTGVIEFVYGAWTAATTTAPTPRTFVVGLKGTTFQSGNVLASKAAAGAWSATTFVTSTGLFAHTIQNTTLPDAGRTYRFGLATGNDAAARAIYTLGKLPIPAGVPHVVQALVTNNGASKVNVPVTLTITGANTFTSTKTLATIAPGVSTTVSFDAFTPTATGTNNLTVTIPADDNLTNNSATFTQVVNNAGVFSYSDPSDPTNSIGYNTGSGILANKYTSPNAQVVTGVSVMLDASAVGKTVYGVLCNAGSGALIARSLDYVVPASEGGTLKTFSFATPPSIAAGGSFLAGLAQTASTTGYFPVNTQAENPTRTGTFYSLPLAGGTPGDVASSNLGRLMIDAITASPTACTPPGDVTVTATTTNSTTITFAGPALATGYTLVYGPLGFNPATGGTTVAPVTSPYTITGLASGLSYQVYLRSNCGATDQSTLTSPVTFTTTCVPGAVAAFPYRETFDAVATGTLPCGLTVADVNHDANTWQNRGTVLFNGAQAPISASGPNAMVYYFSNTRDADDWFFTPALTLSAGTKYQLQFKYRTSGTANTLEKMEVKYGTAATAIGQTASLWQNEALTNAAYATAGAPQVALLQPTTDGSYYVGFHAYSARDQFFLAVDDVQIAQVLGTSDALAKAVSIYPNPSTGIVQLAIYGANASSLRLEVTNTLGQLVHKATVRDNFENQVNLSKLAAGVYNLKLTAGSEFTMRKLVIQ